MKPIKKLITIMIMLSIAVFQTGCWDQKIYEKIGFMLQLGLELDEAGEVQYTTSVPLISPTVKAQESQEKTEILTTKINLLREGRDKARQVSGKTIEGGKIQQIFFSEGMAMKGINNFLEVFLRSPENPLLANVIVVEGSPYELMKLSENFKNKPRPTFYVNGLLESARKNSYVPETRVSHFTILTCSKTIDPTTPLLRYSSEQIQVAGAALFSGDKMVGKIDIKDAALLNGLIGVKEDINYVYQGPYSYKEQEDIKSGAAIVMKNKNRKIQVTTEGDKTIINIKLDFKGYLNEYSGELDLTNPEDKKKLEDAVGQFLKKDYVKLLKYLSQVGSDPVGFGEILRTKENKYWKSIKWKDLYKYAYFNVEAKINFDFYGAVTNQ
ncbi:Ger(x)C family spore germination protein [Clostridium sp. CX1]|uniref:Ger(x)C family spore germination protein n=1 Tax=Clostridium sp. CX1 TaxID=2978346 RepID=UPI0021BE42F5|nr:Ger(x)C family spore germination protein [Clostridium sp. CX1]MCT8975066.1 Ger(x)C family spore germination protein [Clostridium sp. CX1]